MRVSPSHKEEKMTSKIREAIHHLNEDKMTWLRLSKQKKLRRLALAEYRSDVKLIKKLKG